jgi:SpoVK/Ycf46/Vps4 family AAA+-type ATPase
MTSPLLTAKPGLPEWADSVRRKYVGGEASVFLLHGNVFDEVLDGDSWSSLQEFIAGRLVGDNKTLVMSYGPASSLTALKGELPESSIGSLKTATEVLEVAETILLSADHVALIIEYADSVAPAGDEVMLSAADRTAVVRLHQWSLSQKLASKDNVVFLISETMTGISAKLVSNPRIAAIEIALPDQATRERAIRKADATIPEAQVQRLAAQTSGLRAVNIRQILTPQPVESMADDARRKLILSLLTDASDRAERVDRLLPLTAGMGSADIQKLISAANGGAKAPPTDPYSEVLTLVARRKREIIEKECAGLIEFVDSKVGLEAVGGIAAIKRELERIAEDIRSGDPARCPMGLLLVGPMGTGKTFVTRCFARSSGLTAVALKSFRSKWVGSTESNLEKVLAMVKAMGPILLVIDEGDRSFGSSSEDSDGGTSSRVVARIKEFMSDTDNRGKVLFVLMTNRPDRLDTDIKRAGRLDVKIPLFYPDTAREVSAIVQALYRRYGMPIPFTADELEAFSARLVGYSNADLEAVVLLARNSAAANAGIEALGHAFEDYLPSRDALMIEYMNLLAVFEASRRSWLPAAYKDLTAEQISQRLAEAREKCALRAVR